MLGEGIGGLGANVGGTSLPMGGVLGMSASTRSFLRLIVTAVVATSLALAALAAKPGGGPADKVSASGSAEAVAGPNEEIVLLRETVKLSTPTDLMLSVSLECSILTEITTTGNDFARASGTVDVWIEVDGFKVPVSADDTDAEEAGEVTFCSRAYERETTLFDDEDATIRSFIETRSSHAFNWLALDELWLTSDDNIHTIEVVAELQQDPAEGQDDATAEVVVGKRTLIIEPTKVANGEDVTELG